jgi:hypothetical protein
MQMGARGKEGICRVWGIVAESASGKSEKLNKFGISIK